MINWWWLRHGPTHEKSFVGWRDVAADLSDTDAIDRLRAYLPTRAAIVSSDLIRAAATADAIEGASHERLPHTAELREFNFGEWDGLDFNAVSARDPDLSRAYWEHPGDITPPGGESWNQAAGRVARWVETINRQGAHSDVIAVAHFGVILTQVQQAGAMSATEALGQKIDNLSVTRLTWHGTWWETGVINHRP